MIAKRVTAGLALLFLFGAAEGLRADTASANAATKSESFDRDPGWDALNNRMLPKTPRQVTQDFGYNATSGDIGGRVTRAMKPSYYAAALDKPRTLDDKLSASGTFYLTQSTSAGGAFFGWFNSQQREGTGRPANSLGFEVGTERSGGRLAVRLLTANNQGAGQFVTRFENYEHDVSKKAEMRPTSIRNDGTRYTWTLDYDPDGAGGRGQIRFVVKSNRPQPDYFEGKTFTVDLPEGYKAQHTSFDRFGLINGTKPGGTMTIHFDDLTLDGRAHDFRADPMWVSSGSRSTYAEPTAVGAHNFGFSADTTHAGGARAGELGGDVWRGGDYAYYGDRVAPLSLEDRLEARGKVVLESGAPDSDMFIGWFAGDSRTDSPVSKGNFIGIHVGGPTRVGHYFHPWATNANGKRARSTDGPVLRHGKAYEWTFVYDPAGANGNGALTVTMGGETVTLQLKDGFKSQGGRFDHFGLLNAPAGGQLVRIYLDDLTYTAGAAKPSR